MAALSPEPGEYVEVTIAPGVVRSFQYVPEPGMVPFWERDESSGVELGHDTAEYGCMQ